jgi:hypothetical protein
MKNKPWIIDDYYNLVIDDDKKITLGKYLEDKIISINKKIKITQNNYNEYMNLITFLLDGKISKNHAMQLLIKAGGNINGINDAMRIINL